MPKLQAKRLVYLLNCLSNKLDAGAELEFPLKKIWSCGSNAWFRAYGFFNVKSWAIVNQKSKHKTVARRWRYSISNNSRSVETSQQLQKIRLKMHLNEATSTVRMRGDNRLFHSTIPILAISWRGVVLRADLLNQNTNLRIRPASVVSLLFLIQDHQIEKGCQRRTLGLNDE